MTLLQVMPDSGAEVLVRTTDREEIAAALAVRGVRYERWAANAVLAPGAGQDEVLDAYESDVSRLKRENGLKLVDVVRLKPNSSDPQWPAKAKAAREKFLAEHTHDEDEVRFFVEGRGCFYLHLGDVVYAVVCEQGDLLWVPAGTTHWFDMGTQPEFCAIRFFEEEDGWIGSFTGNPVAERIPDLDALLAPA